MEIYMGTSRWELFSKSTWPRKQVIFKIVFDVKKEKNNIDD
jgi:hypothetical protein